MFFFGARQQTGLWLGPVLFALIIFFVRSPDLPLEAVRTLAVTALMITWWVTEAVPLSITALLPLALFPLLGVSDVKDAAQPYANPLILMFLGGFIIASAVQKWNLHRRIAIHMILLMGAHPARIIFGFMLASAFLSMWMSNTAVVMMMVPIGLSTAEFYLAEAQDDENGELFTTALLIGIAYAASIGGSATLIGSPPSALYAAFMLDRFGTKIDFVEWLKIGLPLVVILLPFCWYVLTHWLFPVTTTSEVIHEKLLHEQKILGPMRRQEKRVMIIFGIVAVMWLLQFYIRDVFPAINNTTIAIMGAIVMFLVPSHFRKGEFLLSDKWPQSIDWEVLLLFGGGLSLAHMISQTGSAEWLGANILFLRSVPDYALIIMIAIITMLFTTVVSNTATTATLLPILAALTVGHNPRYVLMPIALMSSYAFILPISTPPNAIAFSSGYISMRDLMRAGWVMTAICLVILSSFIYLYHLETVFG